ncbi:hypothetical protein IO90_08420 [Chryseobacterium sp. FH1]|nr:hypothetical protein IO90_08420 [Chryseobacterium sp. FH1]
MSTAIWGQNNIPEKFRNRYYKIQDLQMSDDRKHVAFNKAYQQSTDTVALVAANGSDSVLLDFPKTIRSAFTKTGNFFVRNTKNAELVLLPSLQKIRWEDIQGAEYSKDLNLILVLKDHLLQVVDDRGNLVRTVQDVHSVHNKEGNLFYTRKHDLQYQLHQLTERSSTLIFESKNEKLDVFQLSPYAYIVFELVEKQNDVHFIDILENHQAKLEHPSLTGISCLMQKPVQIVKGQIFMDLIVKTTPKDRSAVEIWYGNDNYIIEHTYDKGGNVFVLWNPYENKVIKLEDPESTRFFHNGSKKYVLAFDPLKHRDYTKKLPPFTLYRYDIASKKQELLADTGSVVYADPTGKYLATLKNDVWWLIDVETKAEVKIPLKTARAAYFSNDGKILLFENENSLTEYNTGSGKLRDLTVPKGYRSRIISDNYVPISPGSNINRTNFDHGKKLYVQLWNRSGNMTAIASYYKGRLEILMPPTEDYIGDLEVINDGSSLIYTRSNVNMPPQIWWKSKQSALVYDSKKQDQKATGIRSEKITAYNSEGKEVVGVLIYPLDFDKNKKYPMVTAIYESQTFESNKYLVDGMFGSTEGINGRHLVENGYFVFLPSIVYGARGAGFSALDCVDAQLDALQKYDFIDFSRVALIGHSHGGYETSFIATRSDRFATFVSGAGNSDLVRSFNSFNYNFKSPFFWQFEDGQYRMPGPFASNKELYIESSPVYHAENVKRPILLWAGKKDDNIIWDQSMEFYLALRRNNKKVTALFYPEDGHTISKIENRIDLYGRIYDWLDHHLKDVKKDWIQKMDN